MPKTLVHYNIGSRAQMFYTRAPKQWNSQSVLANAILIVGIFNEHPGPCHSLMYHIWYNLHI